MRKTDWLEIMRAYPMALELCKAYFQNRFPENWRGQIKDHQRLFEFFRHRGLEITILEKNRSWGCEIQLPHGLIAADGYDEREGAEGGFGWGFMRSKKLKKIESPRGENCKLGSK